MAHRIYSSKIQDYLTSNLNTITSPKVAEELLNSLQNKIKTQLQEGKQLDEIIFN